MVGAVEGRDVVGEAEGGIVGAVVGDWDGVEVYSYPSRTGSSWREKMDLVPVGKDPVVENVNEAAESETMT